MPKMRAGWVTFTCSEDSTILFLELLNKNFFDWSERIDFVYFNALRKGKRLADLEDVDVFFVEGAISTDEERKNLEHIRNISKHVVAIGACACTGMPSAQRNFFDENTKEAIRARLKKFHLNETVQSVPQIIRVDDMVMGCPMNEEMFVKVLNKYLEKYGV